MHMKKPLYFDYQATTPMDPRILDVMLPYFTEKFGNPHSKSHEFGWESEEAIEKARAEIAQLIHADPKEIVFTSGATESNNLAIKGIVDYYGDQKRHIVTLVTEHKCVLDTCRHLEQKGFEVTYLPVMSNGLVDLEVFKESLRPDTLMVSMMAVNNEIGVIQPIADIGKICRDKGVFFHTDAAQAFGKIELHVDAMNIDLMSISSHKIYGPKGVGALYVRRKPRIRLHAQINGGGQERGMRSGTLPTPLCVGFGEAARLARLEMKDESKRLEAFKHYFWDKLSSVLPDIYLNGDLKQRIPGNLNISFAYVEGESLLMALKDIALSSGSACTSSSLEPSYVLRALGVEEELAHTSLRFGFGRFTTKVDIDYLIGRVVESVEKLREMSPLWEMAQEGIDLKSIAWAGH